MNAVIVFRIRGFCLSEFIEAAAENALMTRALDNKGVTSDIPKRNLEKNAMTENGKI